MAFRGRLKYLLAVLLPNLHYIHAVEAWHVPHAVLNRQQHVSISTKKTVKSIMNII